MKTCQRASEEVRTNLGGQFAVRASESSCQEQRHSAKQKNFLLLLALLHFFHVRELGTLSPSNRCMTSFSFSKTKA